MKRLLFISIAVIAAIIVLGKILPPADVTDTDSASNFESVDRSTSSTSEDPYHMMSVAFEGSPDEEDIRPLIDAVLKKYHFEVSDENALKVGSMLVGLRKSSAVGVTEMEILKHIYQKGSPALSLPDQAGLSATAIELTK